MSWFHFSNTVLKKKTTATLQHNNHLIAVSFEGAVAAWPWTVVLS